VGEACIGDWTYHSYKGLPLLAGQGMIDITGKPLASMAFMQTVWGLRKKPFIVRFSSQSRRRNAVNGRMAVYQRH